MTTDRYTELGHLFADVLERGMRIYSGAPERATGGPAPATAEPVVITGAALGLPGVPRVFDDENVARILAGQQFIDTIPHRIRQEMVDKHITRLVKPEAGDPTFVAIDSESDVIKLAGREMFAVHTPGHTPGHICLHLEDADRLFTGDHVLPDITPHVGIYPYDRDDVDPLGDFLDSLDRVTDLGPLDALPAHEWIFPDVAARAAEIRHHHEEKLERLRALLTQQPQALTIWEVASMMTWNRPWDELPPMLRGMAAGEAAAHLRTLEARGRVRRVAGVDPVRFQALDS